MFRKQLNKEVKIYTDGSCHTQSQKGAWASIILYSGEETLLSAVLEDTTNNQLELIAVCESIQYCLDSFPDHRLIIYTDSQFVMNLPKRREKLEKTGFINGKGRKNVNTNLIKNFYKLLNTHQEIVFEKVVAHQKKTDNIVNYNRKVDMVCRKLMRDFV